MKILNQESDPHRGRSPLFIYVIVIVALSLIFIAQASENRGSQQSREARDALPVAATSVETASGEMTSEANPLYDPHRWPNPRVGNQRFGMVAIRPIMEEENAVIEPEEIAETSPILPQTFTFKGSHSKRKNALFREKSLLLRKLENRPKPSAIVLRGCMLVEERRVTLTRFKRELQKQEQQFPGMKILTRNLKYHSLNEMMNARFNHHQLQQFQRALISNHAKHHLSNALIHAVGNEALKVSGNKILLEDIDDLFSERIQK